LLVTLCNFIFPQKLEKLTKKFQEELFGATSDTSRIEILNRLSDLNHNDFLKAYEYARQALELSEKNNYSKGIAMSYNSMADAYWFHADYLNAQKFYFKALRINDSINDKPGLANSLYNIGWIVCLQQENHKEIGYLYKSYHLFRELQDTMGMLKLQSALGSYYANRFNSEGNRPFYDSALKYYNQYFEVCKSSNGHYNPGAIYGNLGDLMAQAGDIESARFYGQKNLEYAYKRGDSSLIYHAIQSLAVFDLISGKDEEAIAALKRCVDFAVRADIKELEKICYRNLYEAYEKRKDIPTSHYYFKKFVALKDSIDVTMRSSELSDVRNTYEIDKREASIKNLKQENEIQELKNARNKYILFGGATITVIILIIAWLLFKQNKHKNVVNAKLKNQNTIITQKKQEIENSIRYAKGIQTALLPDIQDFKSSFSNSFIYYLPKDVVSGDFYWFHKIDGHFYCVAADCTGHGVPGALMSIVSVDKITQAIFEKNLREPKELLKFLNIEIKKALKQHNESSRQRDGLDIALLKFDTRNNTVSYAGANRPLYVVTKGKLSEFKPDKVAIAGFTDDGYEFNQQTIALSKEDNLYIFSDGYADQFGGQEGKKFMSRNFKSLLESISHLDAESQEKEVINTHLSWKGTHEQVDDILVIGIKV
jgi:serine phosphatase RsbU (regulator of sigma subunit)